MKRAGAHWTAEMKERQRNALIELSSKAIVKLLVRGGSHTAQEIEQLVRHEAGRGYIWDALIKMERSGLVWRAHHFDYRRANNWEITGCGRIFGATAGNVPPTDTGSVT